MLTALAFAVFVIVASLVAARMLGAPATAPHAAPSPAEWGWIGVRIFSVLAAIALVLAALFLASSAGALAWVIGLVAGVALLAAAEFWVAKRFPVTANTMAGAAIGVLYATLYGLHTTGRVAFVLVAIGLVLVTAAAVWIAVKRDSIVIALLGLFGALAAPAIIGFTEEGYGLFAYLLLVNAAAAYLAIRKGWALLIAVAVPVTVAYEWAWVIQHLTSSRLAMTAAMFALIAAAGASPLWVEPRGEHPAAFRRAAAAAALLPLLFAFFMAAVPNYAIRYNVLFAFLLVIAAGLAAVVWRGAPRYLHLAGGIAVLVTFALWFAVWLRQSYVHEAWPVVRVPGLVPSLCLWLALFILLYLLTTPLFAALLFFAFLGLAIRQPQDALILIAAMLLLLALVVWALRRTHPVLAAVAAAFASLTLMALTPLPLFYPLFPAHALQTPPGWLVLFAAHLLVLAALLLVAWSSGRHVLTIVAIPFYAAMLATIPAPSAVVALVTALVPYALFLAYAFALRARTGESAAPFIAACLASLVFLLAAWAALDGWPFIGAIPLAQAIAIGALLRLTYAYAPREPRITLLASTALALFSAAVALLLPAPWTVMVWAAEVAALMYVFTRLPHPAAVVWSLGLSTVIFLRLAFEADLIPYRSVFIVCGLAMFAAAWLARSPGLRLAFSLFGLTELLFRINIEIANWYHSTGGSVNLQLVSEKQDATYTIVWALVATSLLAIGVFLPWRGARVGATSLLLLTILKLFSHDLPHLGDDYRVPALFVVGVSLAIVGVLLQRFIGRNRPDLRAADLRA